MWSFIKDMFNFSEFETSKREALSYALSPSISRYFNWNSFDHDNQMFEMNAGRSVAAVYEIYPLPTEGQPEDYINELAHNISALFAQDVFKQYKHFEAPWIVQFYVSDDYDLTEEFERFKAARTKRAVGLPLSNRYVEIMKTHFEYLQRDGGIFTDPMNNSMFKGRIRRVRMVVYRRLHGKMKLEKRQTPTTDLKATCVAIESLFESLNMIYKRLDEAEFYRWMFRWFSPKPKGYKSSDDYLAQVPFPKTEDDKPVGFDFTQSVFSSAPKSDEDLGLWYFDEIPHRFIPIVGFTRKPENGKISAERLQSKQEGANAQRFAPLDLLPEGSVFMMTVIMQSQETQTAKNLKLQKRARKTTNIDAEIAGEEAVEANRLIALGNHIFPVAMGVYIKGQDEEDILQKEQKVSASISTYMNLKTLSSEKDRRTIDRYLRFLPMNYSYNYDSKYLYQSRLATLAQIAATVPMYGRSRGSGTPMFSFWNRLGEPMFIDPIADKVSNSHMFIFGTTGSGKSNLSAKLLLHSMVKYLPRMVIIDAGGSFKHIVDFMERLGVKTNKIEIRNDVMPDYTLNPFTETKPMLAQVERIEKINQSLQDYDNELEKNLKSMNKPLTESDKARLGEEVKDEGKKKKEGENRDYLMEFVSAAILMVTGSEQKELDAMDRQDRYLILETIKDTARKVVSLGHDQMIPSDLAEVMKEKAKLLSESSQQTDNLLASRLAKMANGIEAFINTPLNAAYFNRRTDAFPEADLTYFELGLYKDDHESNEAPRALAVTKVLNDSMSRAEKYKDEGRPFIFYCDECHVVTSKQITAASVVQATKMGRKNNLWIWLATQNTQDFPDSAARAISMMEYKMLLWSDAKERGLIANFVDITDTQKEVYKGVTKVPGKYTELMVCTGNGTFLCRNVPPREIFALAATADHENTERAELCREYEVDGMVASLLMAQKMRGEALDVERARRLVCLED